MPRKPGFHHSEADKAKISFSMRGRKLTEEHKRKLRGPRYSEAQRRKMSLSRIGKFRGDKNPNWRGGKLTESQRIRRSTEYKLWRTAVFERDNYRCIWCGVRSSVGTRVYLQADHIKPFSLFPELRFAIDNGRTLCLDCHKTTDTYLWKTRSPRSLISQEGEPK